MQPLQVTLVADRTALILAWPDGRANRLEAGVLRRASRAAGEIRRHADNRVLAIESDLRVAAVEPIGAYALRLSFSDGHDRGIYPWSYLRELADQVA